MAALSSRRQWYRCYYTYRPLGCQEKARDAAELSIKTSTGSVTGSLLTDKTFLADSSTGRIDVPQTSTGGRCVITSSTGDIKIEIE